MLFTSSGDRSDTRYTSALCITIAMAAALVAAQLEIRPYSPYKLIGLFSLGHPFFECTLPQSLDAGSSQYYYTAFFYRVLRVVQSFLGLVKVHVLWRSAGRYHDYIRKGVYPLAVQRIKALQPALWASVG